MVAVVGGGWWWWVVVVMVGARNPMLGCFATLHRHITRHNAIHLSIKTEKIQNHGEPI